MSNFSYFNSRASTTPSKTVTLDQFIALIRGDEYATKIQAIRSAPYETSANEIKGTLPAVTPAGVFERRNKDGLMVPSQIVCADIDGLADMHTADETKVKLSQCPHILLAFISPRGRGVKAFVPYSGTDYGAAWSAVAKLIHELTGKPVDPATKDVSRLCFMSHDPDAHVKLAAAPIIVASVPVAITPTVVGASGDEYPADDYASRGDVFKLLRSRGWTSSDDRNWTRPGKDTGVSATYDEVPGQLHIFSSNAPPFVEGGNYTPLQVLALLEFAGDETAALNDLRKRGYGRTDHSKFLILPSNAGLTISESGAQIFGSIAPSESLFVRGGVVHEVAVGATGHSLVPVTPNAFRSRLERYGRPMAWRAGREGKKQLSPVVCAEETAKALLVCEEVKRLPPVRAVVASPILALAPNGEELHVLGRGYHATNAGVFVTSGTEIEDVPLEEAVTAFKSLFDDFWFETEADRSRCMASMLTPAIKTSGLLEARTPIEVAEATESQAGKGFQNALRAALYGEVPTFVTQRSGGVGSLDEELGAALMAGRRFIVFDNLRGKVDSGYLEAVVTADGPAPVRVPYRGTVEIDVRPFTFAMTSNGMQSTVDLANRSCITRIRKRPASFSFKVYPEGSLLNHVKARQGYHLGCVYSIVGAWFADGCPKTGESRHDFREWAGALDWIVRNLLAGAPLLDGHDAARDRVSDPGKSWVRAIALAVEKEMKLDHELTASQLAEIGADADVRVPGVRDDVAEADRARAVGKIMGRFFGGATEAKIEGFVVARRAFISANGQEAKRYRFTRT